MDLELKHLVNCREKKAGNAYLAQNLRQMTGFNLWLTVVWKCIGVRMKIGRALNYK